MEEGRDNEKKHKMERGSELETPNLWGDIFLGLLGSVTEGKTGPS